MSVIHAKEWGGLVVRGGPQPSAPSAGHKEQMALWAALGGDPPPDGRV